MKIIKILIVVCLVLAFVMAGLGAKTMITSQEDMDYDSEISQEYTDAPEEKDTHKPLSMQIDFASLKARNSATIGGIYLPGTSINYPVVQTENNTDYLNKRFDGNASDYGTIFADHRCDVKNGNNIILYGHNQGKYNPVKFTQLHNYLDDSNFIKEHPYFEFYDAETGKGKIYDVFAVLRADITTQINIDNYYRNVSDEKYYDYLIWLRLQSLVPTSTSLDPDHQALILSTCTDDADWQRVLVCCIER